MKMSKFKQDSNTHMGTLLCDRQTKRQTTMSEKLPSHILLWMVIMKLALEKKPFSGIGGVIFIDTGGFLLLTPHRTSFDTLNTSDTYMIIIPLL